MSIELGNRLADLRKAKGYSQEELADKLGLSRQAISKWECGEASPDTDNLIALARLYGISLDELLGVETPKKEEPKAEEVEGEVVDDRDDDDDDDDDDDLPGHIHVRGPSRVQTVFYSIAFPTSIIVYILLGCFWQGPHGNLGWAVGWTVFLLPIIIGSFLRAIEARRVHEFAFPVFVVFLYCGMGIIGNAYEINLWHPYWFLFLLVPVFYSIASAIDNRKK